MSDRRGERGRRDPVTGETEITSDTGGRKGTKPERLELIPPGPMEEVARQYEWGAEKYEDWNFTRGYPWSLSLGAMLRHVSAWQQSEDGIDPESGVNHLAAVVWHALTLLHFQQNPDLYDRHDDRLLRVMERRRREMG